MTLGVTVYQCHSDYDTVRLGDGPVWWLTCHPVPGLWQCIITRDICLWS